MWHFAMKKKESKNDGRMLRNRMAEASGLPKDVVLGMPILTITGQLELNLENYRGILEYTDTLIRIKTKIGQIKVSGTGLNVEYYTNDEMKVTGKITAIEYN